MIRLSGFLFLLIFSLSTFSQNQPFTGNFNENIKFSGSVQFWMRYVDQNPGSTISGTPVDQSVDVSIRRIRFAMTGQLSEKWFLKIQLGANNINHQNPDVALNILDVEAVYEFKPWLQFGGGKTGYTGLSRASAPATASMVGHDWPIFAAPTINISDDLLRRMAIFVKGQIGGLDYRSTLSKPMVLGSDPGVSANTNFDAGAPGIQRSFYAKYQFLDRESNRSAFSPGTYFGAKRIFNIGLGAQLQRDAFKNLNVLGDTIFHDMFLWSADVFLDLPVAVDNSVSINFYSAYFSYDFGPNYVRNIGANNSANGVENGSYNGKGNSFPAVGTGDVIFTQGAIRFATPNFIQGMNAIQPYGSAQVADYQGLDDIMSVYDAGVALLFNGHKSKFTAGYQNRPIFRETGEGITQTNRKSMVILQYQAKF